MTKTAFRPLIIGTLERAEITRVRMFAKENPVTREQFEALAAGFSPSDPAARPKKLNEATTIDLPQGYTVTYTEEMQPAGRHRHLSVSVDAPGSLPSVEAVNALMRVFGFDGQIHAPPAPSDPAMLWVETFAPGREAINVLEKV